MTPCLLFTKIASTITWDQFKAFWPIPLFFAIFSGISWGVARLGSRILRYSSDEEKYVIASIVFSNTNSLPMALVQSLALSDAGTQLLRDAHDTKEQVAARAISYILFYAIFGNLIRWSYGYSLLVPKDPEEPPLALAPPMSPEEYGNHHEQYSQEPFESLADHSPAVLVQLDGHAPPPFLTPYSVHHGSQSSASSVRTLQVDPDEDVLGDEEQGTRQKPSHSRFFNFSLPLTKRNYPGPPSTHLQPLPPSMDGHVLTRASTLLQPESPLKKHLTHRRHRRPTSKILKQTAMTVYQRIQKVLTPPLLTAIVALVIGLVPALHKVFMSPESKFYAFVVHPVEGCGDAAIPLILLCLGAQVVYLATSKSKVENSSSSAASAVGVNNSSSSVAGTDESSLRQDQDRKTLATTISHRQTRSLGTIALAPSRSMSPMTVTGRDPGHSSEDDEEDVHQAAFPISDMIHANNGGDNTKLKLEGGYLIKRLTPSAFVLFGRLILVPLICMPVIMYCPSGLSPELTMDPTFRMTLVLIASSPTAINMIQLCQIKGFFEEDMAGVLFWSYCVWGVPCVLAWSLAALWTASR
ncbi:hypothetical protein EDD11_010365 [Mortierella claussenii]|nr:hypothetical protein EDD11_010365 [Mortierella claussenii]